MGKDTGQADPPEDQGHNSPVRLNQEEQWIPVVSPSTARPLSPAPKDLNKTAATNSLALSSPNGCSDNMASPDLFMLRSSVENHKPTPVSSAVDKFHIGYAPVDIHGRLILDLKNTGGWRAALFIFGNETAERMAFYGILVNLLFYLYLEMHISFPQASTLVTNVVGTSSLTPLLGAFIADAYIGRYWTIGIFSTIYLIV